MNTTTAAGLFQSRSLPVTRISVLRFCTVGTHPHRTGVLRFTCQRQELERFQVPSGPEESVFLRSVAAGARGRIMAKISFSSSDRAPCFALRAQSSRFRPRGSRLEIPAG